MTLRSTVELRQLALDARIGTYRSGDSVPDQHLLDLTLSIDPTLVLIEQDGMAMVFDYDPLVTEIVRLARDVHYETQERLATRIAHACAACPQVEAVAIVLSKSPVHAGTGSLGVRLVVDGADLARLRPAPG
ncbi:MAG: dihydroneopterin aldolase [Hydrogenophaga sp.]|jgi:dihydroneopterin aldolase